MAAHDELFLKPDGNGAYKNTEPTPQPLRINKQGSPQPADEPTQQWAAYNVPPSSSAALFGAPTSPPPTGPLPYPDERTRRQEMPSAEGRFPSRTATPTDAEERRAYNPRPRKTSMGSDASSGAGSGDGHKRRPRFDANDPNRPTLGGYANTSPRLAERRGAPVMGIMPESPGGPELQIKTRTATCSNVHPGNGAQVLSRNNQRRTTNSSFIHHPWVPQHPRLSSSYTSQIHPA